MPRGKVLGVVGWSGSGKTVLIAKLIPLLTAQGIRVATVKHASHAFDVNMPGKDSYVHRKAGASEVIVSSARRWVQMHEVGEGTEATLAELLRRLSPCDIALVEGFKRERHPKLEVFRKGASPSALHPGDFRILAIASDQPFPDAGIPVVNLNDTPAVARAVCEHAQPIDSVLATLESAASD